ncbi:MAG TPA: sensor domain-containing diguanylate cyclase [Candidatus Sulfotelmatobacter sp.]|nr:sensor domain-containing diguanylate cyclase [Candidatus Sulfotelmatobacter sp.]
MVTRSHPAATALKRAAAPGEEPDGDERIAFATAMLAQYPGAVVTVDAAGHAAALNETGRGLVAALQQDESALLTVKAQHRANHLKLQLQQADRRQTWELTALPLADGGGPLLLLGRDVTAERNLTQALVESRQLFKDLVTCSSDFAWQTKADGSFGFVSPRGALGFAARELEGRPARSLLALDLQEVPSPFEAEEALDGSEVRLRRKDGSIGFFEVSCLPVMTAAGEHCGARGVCRDVTAAREREAELTRAHATLERLSRTDELTGLLNRRAFVDELSRRLAHLQRHGRSGALLYLDLDNFKLINDRFGHQRGDMVLCGLAALLTGGSRIGDTAARLGGDEFVLWLEEVDAARAESKAAALVAGVNELDARHGAGDGTLGLSVGIAVSLGAEAATALFARADAAMYEAKRLGKGTVRLAPAGA